jgi:predicted nucleic acid-binding protein
MKFKIKKIEDKNIIIDTNIWLFLFAPSFIPTKKNQNKIDMYDLIFNSLLEKNNFLFNSLIISEFINRCLRLDFNLREEFKEKDFKKDYRNSPQYKKALKSTLDQVEKIYKIAKPLNDDFNKYTLNEFKENLDFNDSIILFQCLEKNLLLLTDDKDFKSYIDFYWWVDK